MSNPLDDARAAVDSSLQSLKSAARREGEHQSDLTTDSAWAAFKEAKAAADAYALKVHEATRDAVLCDVATEVPIGSGCSETKALCARLGGEKGKGDADPAKEV